MSFGTRKKRLSRRRAVRGDHVVMRYGPFVSPLVHLVESGESEPFPGDTRCHLGVVLSPPDDLNVLGDDLVDAPVDCFDCLAIDPKLW